MTTARNQAHWRDFLDAEVLRLIRELLMKAVYFVAAMYGASVGSLGMLQVRQWVSWVLISATLIIGLWIALLPATKRFWPMSRVWPIVRVWITLTIFLLGTDFGRMVAGWR